MATLYKLYLSKDRKTALVAKSTKEVDADVWTDIGEVEGADTFNPEAVTGTTLVNYVRDLVCKAFLPTGELSNDPYQHLFYKGLPSGFNIQMAED